MEEIVEIPKEAKLVFKGILFDVYQWQQKVFNGGYQTYERLKRKNSVNVFCITEDKKIILLDEEQPGRPPFRTVPGGQIEGGEDSDVSARREVLEETGYEVGDLELWQAVYPYGNKIAWTVYSYIARGCKKIQEQHLDGGERISIRLVTFEEFIDIALDVDQFQNMEISMKIMQALRDPEEMERLKKFLFG